jgi:hypothetical protein
MESCSFREMRNGTTSCNPRELTAGDLHCDRQRCRQFVHHSHSQGVESKREKIITRAGQQRYANPIRNSGADEVIIPEYEGGLMTGTMIQKYYPVKTTCNEFAARICRFTDRGVVVVILNEGRDLGS